MGIHIKSDTFSLGVTTALKKILKVISEMLVKLSIAVFLAVASAEDILPRSDACPESHPNAYYFGYYCCASDYEKVYEPQGVQCDGSKIKLNSLCCSDAFMPCPSGLCSNFGEEPCTQSNKAKALYGMPKYKPDLKYNYVIEAYTTVKATVVEPLREHDMNGIYQATMMYTTQKNGRSGAWGYFGVQWKGASFQQDMLLFSIWDKTTGTTVSSYALPNHPNCKRNCNDCNEEMTTGTKCYFNLPQRLQEGDELMLKVEREPVEILAYNERQYKGHVWKVKVSYVSGPNKDNFMADQFGLDADEDFVIGRILLSEDNLALGEESKGGIDGFNNFHEHIGCTPCNSFAFEVERFGPYVTKAVDNENLPELIEGDAWANCPDCTCHSFDVKSYTFGSFKFQTGPGYSPHWKNVQSKSRMYWTEKGEQHARDEQEKPECKDTLSTKRCEKRKSLGKCSKKGIQKKCQKTCELCE